MTSLFFTCPTTHQQAPTGIETDVQSLVSLFARAGRSAFRVSRRGAGLLVGRLP